MTEAQNKPRRRHSAELKQQILAECAQPGASVASVALSHGINANVVHKWRRLAHAPSLVPSLTMDGADTDVLQGWLVSIDRLRI